MSRLAHTLARDGYGWEDLCLRCGISERQARAVVWDVERERIRKLALKIARIHNAAARHRTLQVKVNRIFEDVS